MYVYLILENKPIIRFRTMNYVFGLQTVYDSLCNLDLSKTVWMKNSQESKIHNKVQNLKIPIFGL